MSFDPQGSDRFSEILNRIGASDPVIVEPGAGWSQGRTVFGGMLAALAVEAAQRRFDALPPLRAGQIAFVGPSDGPLTIVPRMVRAGRSTSFVSVDIDAASGPALRATFTFGAARQSRYAFEALPMPQVTPSEAAPSVFREGAPTFTSNFEGLLAAGDRPFTGSTRPELVLWLRHRDPAAPPSAASLLALGDASPPSAWPIFAGPAPVSSITWSFEVLSDRIDGTGWHLSQSRSEAIGDGYSSQSMHLWDQRGRPLLAGRQLVGIYG